MSTPTALRSEQRMSGLRTMRRVALMVLATVVTALALSVGMSILAPAADAAGASLGGFSLQDTPGPTGPTGPGDDTGAAVTVELDGLTKDPSTPVVTILTLTMLSLAPAILLTCTSFTKILVVLSLTRNALGLQQVPPNQVLVGLALFLSLFIMGPVLGDVNAAGLQPFLAGGKDATEAFADGSEPLRTFMLANTDQQELRLLTGVANRDLPANPEDVGLTTLIPAFVLTELKQAFIIGFIIFVPFLVIDIVVSGALMALGMMMMPPAIVSLPFKLLLFVLVNGWSLIIEAVVSSYAT